MVQRKYNATSELHFGKSHSTKHVLWNVRATKTNKANKVSADLFFWHFFPYKVSHLLWKQTKKRDAFRMLSEGFPWQTKAPWVHPNHATHPAKNDHFCRRPLSGTSCNFPATMSTNPSDSPPKKSEDFLFLHGTFLWNGDKKDHFKKVGSFLTEWILDTSNFDIWLDAPAILSGHWEYHCHWSVAFTLESPLRRSCVLCTAPWHQIFH